MRVDPMSADHPAERAAGSSVSRERLWGGTGGTVGTLAGIGGFLVGWLVQREPWEGMFSGRYPDFFRRRQLLPFDFYVLGLLVAGAIFLVAALFLIRVSRYPRTDGSGATLTGTILTLLAGTILFVRLWAALGG